MSLRVWLPFNGNSTNQGISNVVISNTNVGFNTNGKIGSCLETTGQITLNIPQSIYDVYSVTGTEISYSLWIKIDKAYLNQLISTTDFSTKTQMYNKIIGFAGGTTSNGVSIHLRTDSGLTQSTQLNQIYIYSSLRNSSASGTSPVQTINLDEWYHVAITYNSANNLKFYINGILIDSRTITRATTATNISTRSVRLNTPYCQLSNSDANTKHLVTLKEYFNDVRIYDHALSAAEVKKISQGLILHYKLDNNSIPNFLADAEPKTVSLASGSTSAYTSYYYLETYVKSNNLMPQGTKYCVEYDYNVTQITSTDLSLYSQYNAERSTPSTSNIDIRTNSTGHRKEIFTVSNTQGTYSYSYRIRFRLQGNTGGDSVTISNVKIYLYTNDNPSIVYDSSGYGNNGEIVGTFLQTTNTARNSSAIKMNNTGTTNHIESIQLPSTVQTIACWVKTDKSLSQIIFADKTTLMCFGLYQGDSAMVRAQSTGPRRGITNFVTNEWNHIVVVKDNMTSSTYKLYINGIEETTTKSNNYYSHSANNMWLLNRSDNSNYAANAAICDFRVYCTALSAEDILALYNTGAKIDNLHNIHTFEFIEKFSTIKLTKQGQLKEGEIQEATTTKFYTTNKIIEAKNFIES